MHEALQWCEGCWKGGAGAWAYVPAAHVAFYDGAEGADGGCFVGAFNEGVVYGGALGNEVCGAGGVVECGILFCVVFLAAVMQDGGGDGKRVVGRFFRYAGHVEEVYGEAYYGFGVADEAAGAEGYLRVVFAGGGGRHCPEALRCAAQDGCGEGAEGGVGD